MSRWGKLVSGVPEPLVISNGVWTDNGINHPVANFKNSQFRADNNIVEILPLVLGEYDIIDGALTGYATIVLNETYQEQYNTLTKSKNFIAEKKKGEVVRLYQTKLNSYIVYTVSGTAYNFPTDDNTRLQVASYVAMLAAGRTYDVGLKITTVDILTQAQIDAGDSPNMDLVRVSMTEAEFDAFAKAMTDHALTLLLAKGDHIEAIEADLADGLVSQSEMVAYDTSIGW